MKSIARSLIVILVALIAVPALAVSYTIATAVQLLATTALIMGGTEHPLSFPTDDNPFVNTYMSDAVDHYIEPGADPEAPITTYAVVYPAEFFPTFGSKTFDDSVGEGVSSLGGCLGATDGVCITNNRTGIISAGPLPPLAERDHYLVFGYSQSAVVASLVKNQMIADADPNLNGTEFVLLSNPMRPNGGILGRGFQGLTIPIIGITFYGPTQNSCDKPCTAADDYQLPTVDVAQQYDFLGGDAPARLSPLAFANSIASYALLHGNMPNRTLEGGMEKDPQVIFQDEYGDTEYYMVTAPRLPLLMLLEQAGVPSAALALPDALLRVWIEDKYRRDLSPGEHVQFQLSPIGNPIALVGNMLGAIPVGIDDTVAQATGNPEDRPLGTNNVYRPFGVGGPVYNPETGEPDVDNVGIPTGAGDYSTQESIQTFGQPGNNKLNLNEKAGTFGNVLPEADEGAEGTKPDPPRFLRGPISADRPRPLAGLRPNGEGPLKKIVNALTGQKPESGDDAPEKSAEGEQKAAA